MDTINVMSLCSGGGGLDLGFKLAVAGARTVCWVEWEAFAASVLADRMEAKFLDEAPLWSDLRTFDGKPWRGVVDCLLGGYPCQPFSVAGKRRGSDDPRHLWPHVARVVEEVEPAVCFLENVSGHLSLGFWEVAERLEKMGRKVAAGLFTAEEVGASHKRDRLFILSVVNDSRLRCGEGWAGPEVLRRRHPSSGASGSLVYGDRNRCQEPKLDQPGPSPHIAGIHANALRPGTFPPGPDNLAEWVGVPDSLSPAQSKVRLLADGLAADRPRWIKLFGNGVVPLQAAYAFCSLWAALRL